MRTCIRSLILVLVLVVAAVHHAHSDRMVSNKVMAAAGDRRDYRSSPVGVANRQAVYLSFANSSTLATRVSLDIFGGKVSGNMWTPTLLASQKDVLVGVGQATILTVNWQVLGGLADGERAQVFGQINAPITSLSFLGSLQVTDLQGNGVIMVLLQ